jgi:hypothetical protein
LNLPQTAARWHLSITDGSWRLVRHDNHRITVSGGKISAAGKGSATLAAPPAAEARHRRRRRRQDIGDGGGGGGKGWSCELGRGKEGKREATGGGGCSQPGGDGLPQSHRVSGAGPTLEAACPRPASGVSVWPVGPICQALVRENCRRLVESCFAVLPLALLNFSVFTPYK